MVLVALLGLGFQLQLPRAFPSDADYRAVAAAAGRRARAGRRGAPPSVVDRACTALPSAGPAGGGVTSATRPTTSSSTRGSGCWPTSGSRARPSADFRRNFLPDRTPVGDAAPVRPAHPHPVPERPGAAGGPLGGRGLRPAARSRWRARPAPPPSPATRSGTRVRCPFDALGGGRVARGALPAGALPVRASPVRRTHALAHACPTAPRRTRSCSRPASPGSTPGSPDRCRRAAPAGEPRRCAPPPRSRRARGLRPRRDSGRRPPDRGPCG